MAGYERAAERLGQRIRELRRQKGLTQKELAEKAGVFDVGELERARKVKTGLTNPRLETLYKIAVALDVSLEELFGHPGLDEEALEIRRLLEGKGHNVMSRVKELIEVIEKWEKK